MRGAMFCVSVVRHESWRLMHCECELNFGAGVRLWLRAAGAFVRAPEQLCTAREWILHAAALQPPPCEAAVSSENTLSFWAA